MTRSVGHGQVNLLPFEEAFLDRLLDDHGRMRLGQLAAAVQRFQHGLVHEAVSHGWLRHLHHDQRTPDGDQLAEQIRSFRVGRCTLVDVVAWSVNLGVNVRRRATEIELSRSCPVC